MEAGGAKAGTLELVSTSYEKALEHAKSKGIDIEEMIPAFKRILNLQKNLTAKGLQKEKI